MFDKVAYNGKFLLAQSALKRLDLVEVKSA